jgi:alkanesulfonate monooxygenase SsuD/methylene tetrahydromethanopterin reductase-like flavin-dependent oxidoreductase (luciferase family)
VRRPSCPASSSRSTSGARRSGGTASIETSAYALLVVEEDGDRARALQRDYLRGTGVDLDSLDAEQRAAVTAMQFVGTPDDVAADLQARVLDTGVDGLITSMPANGHQPCGVPKSA